FGDTPYATHVNGLREALAWVAYGVPQTLEHCLRHVVRLRVVAGDQLASEDDAEGQLLLVEALEDAPAQAHDGHGNGGGADVRRVGRVGADERIAVHDALHHFLLGGAAEHDLDV